MPKKGVINNPAGRKKGTPNKATAELKQWIQCLIDDNRIQLEQDLMRLDPKDRWIIVERLMQYTTPKMANIEAKLSDEDLNQVVNEILKNINDENTN